MTEIPVETQQASILGLPAELLQHILSYLEPLDLGSVAQTCTALSAQSYDDQIWQPIINRNLARPITEPTPLKSFRELYLAHHPHWFLPKHQVWFADSPPYGKLVIARYDERRGCIEAYAVAARRGRHALESWEKDREVVIHSFNPEVSLHLDQPVLKLDVDSPRTSDQSNHNPSDRAYGPPSRYSKEILMETSVEAGLYSSFMLCRQLPRAAMSEQTSVWPPMRLPAETRVRNDSGDGYLSAGHRPTRLDEVSQHNFRLRKWVEYTGRRTTPTLLPFNSPNGLSAALGLNNAPPAYFNAGLSSTERGGMSIRMPEDIATYATLSRKASMPRPGKEWQGIWCGDYSGHGCEFLVITQPDKEDEQPLPEGMDWLRAWFRGGIRRSSSESSEGSYVSAQEQLEVDARAAAARQIAGFVANTGEDREAAQLAAEQLLQPHEVLGGFTEAESSSVSAQVQTAKEAQYIPEEFTDYPDAPTGRLEAIKLTGDPNIPRGEYTFIAPDIGHGGFMRVCDEEKFKGARVVRSAGHIAGRGFREGTSLHVVQHSFEQCANSLQIHIHHRS